MIVVSSSFALAERPAAPVVVSSYVSMPVPVAVVKDPFVASAHCTITGDGYCMTSIPSPPTWKRYVIEFAECYGLYKLSKATCNLRVPVKGEYFYWYLTMSPDEPAHLTARASGHELAVNQSVSYMQTPRWHLLLFQQEPKANG